MDSFEDDWTNDSTSKQKHSLYKIAGPLQKRNSLHQGKLQTMASHGLSSRHEEVEDITLVEKSPTRFQPGSLFLTGEHTHSLSLSDTEEGSPQHNAEQAVPVYTISSPNKPVLLVDAANTSEVGDMSHSRAIEVTSMHVPSPVKVVSHYRENDSESRRFSTNFVNSLPAVPSITSVLESRDSGKEDQKRESSPLQSLKHEIDTTVGLSGDVDSLSSSVQVQDATVKKKKGRVVASRYMSTGSSRVTSKPSKVTSKPQRAPKTATTQHSTSVAAKLKPSKNKPRNSMAGGNTMDDGFKVPTVFPRPKQISSKRPHVPLHHNNDHHTTAPDEFFQTPVIGHQGVTTSTPFQHSNTPATHDGSFMADFSKPPSAIKSSAVKGRGQTKPRDKGRHIDELEMELNYTRLIQFAYLDIMSCQALKNQEKEAKGQVHGLWQAVENKKEEVSLLTKQVENEARNLAIDKTLDIELNGLGPVCSKLNLLEQQHNKLAHALDTTRHDMVLEGIATAQEGDIEAMLLETEELLAEVNSTIRDKIPKILKFSSSAEAIVAMVEREYQDLDICCEELSKLILIQVKNTSLHFEKQSMARTT